MRQSLFVPVVLLALGSQAAAQLPPPPPPALQSGQPVRDPLRRLPPDPTGTASIRGRVVAGDTGAPMRKANVNLSAIVPITATPLTAPVQPTTIRPRTTVTDAQGIFEFKDLPAGSYRLTANPGQYSAQYLSTTYGAKRANAPGSSDPGQPIPLTDGQAFTATLALLKGSVITGRVSDENGDSLARVQVYTLFYPVGSTRGQRFGSQVQTDDLGNFRLFGLAPGDYVVVAEAPRNTFIPPNAPPETEEERIGMLTTYYPGTADEGSAQRVRTRTGLETSGIEIRMLSGRLLHVSGMVVDSQGKTDSRFSVQLMQRSSSTGFSNFGLNVDGTGHFQGRNIAPGDYKLVVRQIINRPPNADPRTPTDPGEFAVVPISLATDIDDLLVTTGQGVTISGQIQYETGPPTLQNGQPAPLPRINAQPPDPQTFGGLPTPPGVQASADLTFIMKGFMGEYLIRASSAGAYLKSVLLNGEDIVDTPHEFKQGDKITVVMTTRASTIEGTVTDDKGSPANTGSLVLFSEDKTYWRNNSIRTRRGGVDMTGHFRMMGVLPGRYFLIALPQERANALNYGTVDPSMFEQFAKEATTVTVGDDEQRQVDLRISPGSGGLRP